MYRIITCNDKINNNNNNNNNKSMANITNN